MAQKKKVVTTANKSNNKPTPTSSKLSASSKSSSQESQMLFGRENYIYMGAGVLLIGLGMLLMTGGGMDDPNVWDESVIYSFRRITLAPMLIIAGLAVEVVGIFK
jgi:hypothetical protein